MNRSIYELRLVLTAIQYFTRLPVPRWAGYSNAQLNDAVRYFPLTGMLVGAMTGAVFLLAHKAFQQPVAVVIAMIAGLIITGGFHEDGLADTCDGFGAGRDKAHVLAIMKDSRVGSYGVLGLVSALLLKFSVLSQVPADRFLVIAVAAHAVSRFMAVSVIYSQEYVRHDDSARAKPAAQSISAGGLGCAGAIAAVPVLWLGAAGIAAAAAALIMRMLLAQYLFRRIGGYTGDCLGAIQQVTELAFYLGLLGWTSI